MIEHMVERTTEQHRWRSWMVWGCTAAVTLGGFAALVGFRQHDGVRGVQEIKSYVNGIQVLSDQDAPSADEVNLFTAYNTARTVLALHDPVAIRVPWVEKLTGFTMSESAKLFVDDDKQSIALVGRATDGPMIGANVQVVDVLITADWDEANSADSDPTVNVAIKAENIALQDFSDLFGDVADALSLKLDHGWVIFTNRTQQTLDLGDLPSSVVRPFYQTILDDELLAGGQALHLTAGANFMADLALEQMPSLKRAVSFAGVDAVHLRLYGSLSTNAGLLFDDESLDELAAFHVTGSLDATGTSPPPWLTDRAFTVDIASSDVINGKVNPIVTIGDTIGTLIGGATNAFHHGFTFDPASFSLPTSVPLTAHFDLVDTFAAPFGIDPEQLLADLTPGDLQFGFDLTATVDLSVPDLLTAASAAIEIRDPDLLGDPATVRIELSIDSQLGVTVANFTLSVDLSAQDLVDALASTFGATSFDLDDVGGLTLDAIGFEARSVQGATALKITASLGAYDNVLGFAWLDMTDLTVTFELSNDGVGGAILSAPTFNGLLAADVTIGGIGWHVELALEAGPHGVEFRVSFGTQQNEDVPMSGLIGLFGEQLDTSTFDLGSMLEGLTLHDLSVTFRAGTGGVSVDATSGVTLPSLNVDATLYFSVTADSGVTPTFFVGVRPTETVKLGSVVAMAGLENVDLPNLALIFTTGTYDNVPASDLTHEGYEFLKGVNGCAADAIQPTLVPVPPVDPKVCAFGVHLAPGVNLVANIDLPEPLEGLTDLLWMDPDRGVQIVGSVTPSLLGLPNPNSGELKLRLALPVINPPETVDFIEEGSIAIEAKVTFPNLSVGLSLQGELATRFRRSETPATSCALGELLDGVNVVDDVIEHDNYCYDRLRFTVSADLVLSTTKLDLKFTGGLVSNNPAGWQQPFGVTWLTIKDFTLQFGASIEFAGPSLNFQLGIAGNVIVGDKELSGALSVGMKILPAPPPAGVAVVPQFFGVRGYVGSLGSTDLVKMYSALTGQPEFPVQGLPLFEVRNAEFMFALEDNPALCLTTGIGIAGELFLLDELPTGPAPTRVPPTPPGGCAPFGANVDPDSCFDDSPAGRRDDGCFASYFAKIDFTGIRVNGAVGPMDLGPVHLAPSQLKFILTPDEQTLAIQGGVTVDGLGGGEVGISVGLTHLSLYGKIDVFDAFEAEVEAEIALGLAPPFTPTFDASFHAALGAGFDDAFEALVDDLIDALVNKVQTVRDKLDSVLNASPSTFTSKVAALLTQVNKNTVGFDFLDDLAAAVEQFDQDADSVVADVENLFDVQIEFPTVEEFFDGGSGYIEWGAALVNCSPLDHFDEDDGVCRNGDGDITNSSPVGICLPVGEGRLEKNDGIYVGRCRITINVPGLPGSYNGILGDIKQRARDGLEAVATKLDNFVSGLSLDALLDKLESLNAPSVFSLDCANFSFDTASGNSTVAMQLKASLLNHVFGFDLSLDLTDLDAAHFFDELMQQFLGDPESIQCVDHLTPPEGLSSAAFLDAAISIDDSSITEGDTIHASVTVTGDAGGAPIEIDWGDGSARSSVTLIGGHRTVAHTYLDDPSGPAPQFTVRLLIDGNERDSAAVTVANARPDATISVTPSPVAEGDAVALSIAVSDPGVLDTHQAVVTWGDGATQTVSLPLPQPLQHAFADDNPTGTTSDPIAVAVRVIDDDGGADSSSKLVTVTNVAPRLDPNLAKVISGLTINESASVGFTVVWTDPGADSHRVVVGWGDGTTTDLSPAIGDRSVAVAHTYADDNPTNTPADPFIIMVRVTDDDTGAATLTRIVTVHNVAPSGLSAVVAPTTIAENQSVTVAGSFTDPGLLDTHVVRVKWGDASLPDTVLNLPLGQRSYTATKVFGDNSGAQPFTISVTVTDDDTGAASVDRQLGVSNVAPTATIGTAGSRFIGGADSFIVRTGDGVLLSMSASDPGSDDLGLTWDFDTLTPATNVTTSSLVPGQSMPDQLPSPQVIPRTGSGGFTDSRTTSYAAACRYDVGMSVVDDDAGLATDSAVVIVVGRETLRRTAGYWTQQYAGKGGGLLPTALRLCYLRIVDHLSSTFGPSKPVLGSNLDPNASFKLALAILDPSNPQTDLKKLDRQLLAGWLAIANGSLGYDQMVDTDGNGTVDMTASAFFTLIESGRPTAPAATLTRWGAAIERILLS